MATNYDDDVRHASHFSGGLHIASVRSSMLSDESALAHPLDAFGADHLHQVFTYGVAAVSELIVSGRRRSPSQLTRSRPLQNLIAN